MKRCSFREWIPILPWPIWPLAWQCALGQNAIVGSMTILLAVRGNIATRSMSGPPFSLQLHCTTVWCGANLTPDAKFNDIKHAYRTLVKRWHPDRFATDTDRQRQALEHFYAVTYAYA